MDCQSFPLHIYLKSLRQPSQKFWLKSLARYFFYSNLYLYFLRSCCQNFFKIVFLFSEIIGKQFSQFPILFFASFRRCLQFQPPSMKPTFTRCGVYLTKRFQTSASTRRAHRSDAATFNQDKQIFLSTLPSTGFNTEVCSYSSLF